MDIKTYRENRKKITSAYWKDTFSGVETNITSFTGGFAWFFLDSSKFYQAFTNVRKFFLNAIIHRNKLTKYILRFSNPAFKRKIEIATVLKKELSIVLSYLGNVSN